MDAVGSYRQILILLAMLAFVLLAGCADEPLESTDVKKFDQPVSEEEFRAYMAVVDSLPDKKVPQLPPLFLPPPAWNMARSLPVYELSQLERKSSDEHMSVTWFVRNIPQSKAFLRALRKERMTVPQFVGLTVALGLAQSRNELTTNEEIDKVLARGLQVVAGLEKDKRVFNTLSADSAYYIVEQAAWIPLVDRLKRMKKVPMENCELVKQHREELDRVFPEDLRRNPLQGLAKLLEDESLPFTDPSGTNPDDHIAWNRDTALVGGDATTIPLKTAHEPAGLIPVPRTDSME